MKSLAGFFLAALSVIGLAHQNKVVTPPTLAVTFPKAAILSVPVPGVVIAPVAKPSKAIATKAHSVAAGIVLGTSTSDSVVTQSQLQAAIEQASNALRQLIYANAGTVGQGQYSSGGYTNNLALSQRIDSLSNVTITNATLTASEIPANIVAANYLPLSGGTVSGTFSVLGSTTLSNLTLGTNCSSFGNGGKLTTDAFGNVHCADDYGSSGGAGLPGGSNTQVQFNDSGSFAGNSTFTFNKTTDILTVANASTTNLTTNYASTTNLFAGTLALTNALGLASGGTGISSVAAGSVLLGNYAGTGYQQLATSSLGLLTSNVAEGSNLYFTNSRAQAALAISGLPLTYTAGVIGINQANAATNGFLASTDWATFNGKLGSTSLSNGTGISYNSATGIISNTGVVSLAATYPLQTSGSTGALTISIAFGTTTANIFSALNTFNGGVTANVLTAGTSASLASTTLTGSTLLTNATTTSFAILNVPSSLLKTLTNGAVVAAVAGIDYQAAGTYLTALGSGYATTTGTSIALSTSTQSFNGLTIAQNITASAAAFTFVPNISGTLNNAGLTNSTISGVSLGSNLASLSATDGTLTFSGSYNGGTARTMGLNLGNVNSWTGLQQFNNASTTLFSAYGPVYFGATATSSFASNGALTLATALTVPNGGTGATSLAGFLQGNGTGAITGVTGTAGQFPYYNGTNTLLATSSLFLATSGNVGIASTSPWGLLSINPNGISGPSFVIGSSTVTNFIVTNGGNVGIGTSSPAASLAVSVPTAAIAPGIISIHANPSGTSVSGNCPDAAIAGSYCLNTFKASTENIGLATNSGLVNGLSVFLNSGGANMVGGRQALYAQFNLSAASAANNPTTSRSYVGGTFWAQSAVPDGGTGTGASNSAGDLYGGNSVVTAYNGATNFNQFMGHEIDTNIESGSSAYIKGALALVQGQADAVRGSVYDAALHISNAVGAIGWNNGILFGNQEGAQPISSSGCLICTTGAASAGTGIDLSSYTFSTAAYKSNGFEVTGTGLVGIGTTTPNAVLHVIGSSGTASGGEPTYHGDIRLIGNSGNVQSESQNGGLEFKSSAFSSGYGYRILAADFGTVGTPLLFQGRENSAAWSDFMTISSGGNVGIGTTNPYSRLSVWGTNTASSTLAFNIVNSASTTLFAVFDGGNAQLSGTLTQSSDRRLKTNIFSLDASSSLSSINALTPVAYDWLDPEKRGVRQYGFIAQDVQQVFPNLVATTSATVLTPDGTLGLNYLGLIAPIVEAVQQLSAEVQRLTTTVVGFAESFTSKRLTATQKLCVGDGPNDSNPVCITKSQLAAILAGSSQPSIQISAPTSPIIGSTTTPPSINIQGSNPATINVGDTYTDLGAIVHDNQSHDLSYRTFINGVLPGNILIDTSQVATDTIDYVATDTWGNTATSTRTIIVQTAAAPSSI